MDKIFGKKKKDRKTLIESHMKEVYQQHEIQELQRGDNVDIRENDELIDEGGEISNLEARLILLSISIGIGYINFTSFNSEDSNFYIVPLFAVVANLMFGVISVLMFMDAKRIQEKNIVKNHMRLGSIQEMMYYFKSDRGLIVFVGLQFGAQCLGICSYCMWITTRAIVDFSTWWLLHWHDKDTHSVERFVIYGSFSLILLTVFYQI